VAVWLSAINVTKAGIARLIITIHREGTNAANSSASAPLAISIGMEGGRWLEIWHAYSSAVHSLVGSAAANPVRTFTSYP